MLFIQLIIVNSQAFELFMDQMIQRIPPGMPLYRVLPFLQRAIPRLVHRCRQKQVIRHLCRTAHRNVSVG